MAAKQELMPEGVHHYDESSEMPEQIQKCDSSNLIPTQKILTKYHRYWHQRYDIWSRYDEGIWMTDDVWFGVTPEPIAK